MAPATLPTLPPELLQQIQSHLPYPSRLALRLTSRALYLMSGHPGGPSSYTMSDLLTIETWPCYHGAASREQHLQRAIAGQDFFACSRCLRIRSALRFSNAMMRGRRGKASTLRDRAGRICIPCGIKTGVYRRGDSFDFGGAPVFGIEAHRGVVCSFCDEFHSASKCPNCRKNERGDDVLANPKAYTYS